MPNDKQWCFAWIQPSAATQGQTRAALVKADRWAPGDIITVSFLDGDRAVQDKVQAVASEWTVPGLANLKLSFRRDTTDTMIRISFKYDGSWSTIGRSCTQVPKGQPTMNYGWLTPTTPTDELRRVVLHEFGHALGLIHEHQNPAGGIQWNRPAVYRELSGPPNNWSKDDIDFNVVQKYSVSQLNGTSFDRKSIMLYQFPKEFILAPASLAKTGTATNTDLSAGDKSFVKKLYKP